MLEGQRVGHAEVNLLERRHLPLIAAVVGANRENMLVIDHPMEIPDMTKRT